MHKLVMKGGTLDRVLLSEIVERDGFNARGKYEHIANLVESIKEHGLQQPLACYRLDVGEDDHDFAVIFLQSGYRRRRALDVIAKELGDPDMLVDVAIKTYASHDAAMVPALAVDSSGEPLRNYDLAVRLTYLSKKNGYTQGELARLTGINVTTVNLLLLCLRDLHPRITKMWEKAPSPKMEIPLHTLALWAREPQSDQMMLLEAYVNGDEIVDRRGIPKKNKNGRRLDGKKTKRRTIRAQILNLEMELNQGGDPIRLARLDGAVRGLRFALGDITKVF